MRALVLYVGEMAVYPGHTYSVWLLLTGEQDNTVDMLAKIVNQFIAGLIVKCLNIKIFCREN